MYDGRAPTHPMGVCLSIGLISTAIGGSMIEQWLLNDTMHDNCANLSIAKVSDIDTKRTDVDADV